MGFEPYWAYKRELIMACFPSAILDPPPSKIPKMVEGSTAGVSRSRSRKKSEVTRTALRLPLKRSWKGWVGKSGLGGGCECGRGAREEPR